MMEMLWCGICGDGVKDVGSMACDQFSKTLMFSAQLPRELFV